MSDGTETRAEGGYLTRYAGLPQVGWSGASLALGVVIFIAALSVGLTVVSAIDPGAETPSELIALQFVFATALGGTAVALAILDANGDVRGAMRRLGLRRVALSMIGLAALAWFVYTLFAATAGSLLDPEQDPITDKLGTDESSAVSVAITAALVIPAAALSEELFFRGFMFGTIRNMGLSLWPAALITSLVWALLHLAGGNLGVVAILAAFGLVLAWLYERSGSLWVPIAAHALNNTIAFLVLLS